MNDWIPRLLSEEENSKDSWKAIPKYLPYTFGGLNYLTSFLQASIYPSSTKNSFSIFLELKTTCNVISHQEFALFNNKDILFGMDALSINIALKKVYILFKIF